MSDKPSFVYVSYIATTRDKLWAALTDSKFTREYWGRDIESDWKPGSLVRLVSAAKTVEGKILELEPGAKLVMTWRSPLPDGTQLPTTKVSFTIEPAGPEDVKLTVVHEAHDPGSEVGEDLRQGWPAILSSLKTLLETGRGLDVVKRWSTARR